MQNILFKIAIFYASVMALSTISFSAQAREAIVSSNMWQKIDLAAHYNKNGFSKEQIARFGNNEIIYTSRTDKPGLMFYCLSGKFRVASALAAIDWSEAYTKSTKRIKLRSVDISLDSGEKIRTELWTYKPALKIITARNRKQAAQLYNAVIKGQDITVFMSTKNPVALSYPKPNSVFANFGAKCGIGNNKPE